MNNLNSILIEGEMNCDPIQYLSRDTKKEYGAFSIDSCRLYEEDAEVKKYITSVSIRYDEKLINKAQTYGKKGRGVRVVGRLEGTYSDICIVAEYIEFRPEFKKTNSTKKKQQAKINKE